MTRLKRSELRHLVMRLALGFVLGWFGVQELHSPSDWGVFVPALISSHAPNAVNNLVIAHGFLLTLGGASVLFGLFYLGGALLAVGLLGEVVIALWADSGMSDLVIRDIGLLGLAAALAVDPVRVWHLDDLLLKRMHAARRPSGKKKGRLDEPVPLGVLSWARAGSGALLAVSVLALAAVLRVTGSSGSGLPPDPSVFASGATPAAAQATSEATPVPSSPSESSPTPGQPAAAATDAPTPGTTVTSIQFASWQFHDKSFQVYPGAISSETKRALAGFELTVQDQGTQVVLLLKALSPEYHDASIPVDKADAAYFVETSMRDDPNDQENNLNDDGVIIVNPDGYIVQS